MVDKGQAGVRRRIGGAGFPSRTRNTRHESRFIKGGKPDGKGAEEADGRRTGRSILQTGVQLSGVGLPEFQGSFREGRRPAPGDGHGVRRGDWEKGVDLRRLSGSVMVIGMALGRKDPKDKETLNRVYAACRAAWERFEKEFGTTGCYDLTGCPFRRRGRTSAVAHLRGHGEMLRDRSQDGRHALRSGGGLTIAA